MISYGEFITELKFDMWRRYKSSFVFKTYLWFMYRVVPKHQYHMIDTGMKPAYYDISIRMEAALVKLVIDFVELEQNPGAANFVDALDQNIKFWEECNEWSQEYRDQRIEKEKEFKDLYVWCKKWYSTLTYEEDIFYDEENRYYDYPGRKEFDKEVDVRMKQIVDFRNHMWT